MKAPIFVYAWTWELDENGKPTPSATLTISLIELKPSQHTVLVGHGTADFTIDENTNVVAQQVAGIDREIEQRKEEYYQTLAGLEETKKNLLSLEFTPQAPGTPKDDIPF